MTAPPPRHASEGWQANFRSHAPGVALTAGLAAVATVLGGLAPVIGGPVLGILLGLVVGSIPRVASRAEAGASVSGTQLLQASVVLLGAGLSLWQVLEVGAGSLPVMLGTLAVALGGAWLVGGLLRVDRETRLLIGVGTGICGASAIAAVTAVVGPQKSRVAQAIGTIFAFNIAAVLIFPGMGRQLGLSQEAFGMWAGSAVNDTSSVVAAAYTYGVEAGDRAVVVKLTRAMMIVPICLALSVLAAHRRARTDDATTVEGAKGVLRLVPGFIIGFLVASTLRTVGVIPEAWQSFLASASLFLMTMALAGIGVTSKVSTLRRAGWAPLLLGGILFLLVAVASLLLQWATGRL